MKTKIPPPLFALLAGFLIYILHNYIPGPTIVDPLIVHYSWITFLIGGAFPTWAIITFRRAHTTLDPTDPGKASRLVIHGPYRLTRNPMYLGLFLVLFGWTLWLGNLTGFLVLPVFIMAITYLQVIPEERALSARFGEEYLRYRRQVYRWFGCTSII
jgi:protein-S-isoprenylcysteine O-methyltransferase Ste14